jgi:hypothetical protein
MSLGDLSLCFKRSQCFYFQASAVQKLTLKVKVLRSFETSRIVHPTIQCYMPGDLNVQNDQRNVCLKSLFGRKN